jgi:MFS family permease
VAGPFTGGFLVDHFSWRWVFYVNLPLGLVALALTALGLRLPPQPREHAIDYLGAALLAGVVTSLLLMLVWGGTFYPWSSPAIVGLALATVVLAAASVVQERRAPEPVLPLPLLTNPVLAVSSATLIFSTRVLRRDRLPAAVLPTGPG